MGLLTEQSLFLRGALRVVVTTIALISTGCNQERSSLPAKPSQGLGAAPGSNTAAPAMPGVPRGRLASATEDLAARARMGDFALADTVKTAIASEPELESLILDVTAKDGAITLHGTAGTDAERDRATLVASGIAGVQSVKNELVIVRGS